MSDDAFEAVRCMVMRSGTSKGAYFLAEDLPADPELRDQLLIRVMGSPDARQIDGIGGAHPLTSKVGVVSKSDIAGVDVDYLFLQVFVDEALVSDKQNCGNILAGIGPFAIERGLVSADADITKVTINMVNTNGRATAAVETPNGRVNYAGDTEIAGVPGSAAPIVIDFESAEDTGSVLLPTGRIVDSIDGVDVTCVDNGMPVVVMRALDLGVTGQETLRNWKATPSFEAGWSASASWPVELMGLGDVSEQSVPKLTMVSPAMNGGAMSTRTFIPHRCHTSIGVLGAASVAVACAIDGTPVNELVSQDHSGSRYRVEHPTGHLDVEMELDEGDRVRVSRTGVVRTARKLFDGTVFPRP